MKYEMIKIYDKPITINKDKYNFVIWEKWVEGWGRRFAVGRRRPKFYGIYKNGNIILSTGCHQTFYSYKRKLLGK